jgi:peptidyl-prolyl cis-trans isomerase A (cyclophilin A)/peptidyl-prolyl cis-trans isomerase B (cyclophilin B)
MQRTLAALAIILSSLVPGLAPAANPTVEMRTTAGTMVIELFPEKAPQTVANFLQYAREGFYKGTIFHRVIPGFMIQGGGFTSNLNQKATREPVRNEANNGLKNLAGTVAMARTSSPHSATAQFFINVVDNPFLDHTAQTARGWGYCVFGKVVKGMDVAQAIVSVPTAAAGPFASDVPVRVIEIEDVRVLSDE